MALFRECTSREIASLCVMCACVCCKSAIPAVLQTGRLSSARYVCGRTKVVHNGTLQNCVKSGVCVLHGRPVVAHVAYGGGPIVPICGDCPAQLNGGAFIGPYRVAAGPSAAGTSLAGMLVMQTTAQT